MCSTSALECPLQRTWTFFNFRTFCHKNHFNKGHQNANNWCCRNQRPIIQCKLQSRVVKDHFLEDLDQRSRSKKWSRSIASKDHLKIIDLDQRSDHFKRSFSSEMSVFISRICKQTDINFLYYLFLWKLLPQYSLYQLKIDLKTRKIYLWTI